MFKEKYPLTIDELEGHIIGMALANYALSNSFQEAMMGHAPVHEDRLDNLLNKLSKFMKDCGCSPEDRERVEEALREAPVQMGVVKYGRSMVVSGRQSGKTMSMSNIPKTKGRKPLTVSIDDIDDWWMSGVESSKWYNNEFRQLVEYQPPQNPHAQRGKSRRLKNWEHNPYGTNN